MNKIRIEYTKNPYKLSFNGIHCSNVTLYLCATVKLLYSVNYGLNGIF